MTRNPETLPMQPVLELLNQAILITDADGQTVFETACCQRLFGQFGAVRGHIAACAAAAAVNGEASCQDARFSILCTVIPDTDPKRILVQVHDALGSDAQQAFTDSDDRSEDLSVRLSKLKLRDCIANSVSMIRMFEKAKQVANYPTTVLLVGETGVGKEIVASFIHRNSHRASNSFIKINCSAIPEQLLESELFGYESGAFTGAKIKGKPGLFELANDGTLLLDEIGDMPIPLQAKLLRVLQENEIMRLGGQKNIPLNVRVISSTNRNLKELMEAGLFSEALYYRLNVVELNIPPLRERTEDILPLSTFFMSQFCEKYKLDKVFSQEIKECFIRYDWPGNVRELRNMVENIVVSSESNVIGLEDLPQRMIMNRTAPVQQPSKAPDTGVGLRDAVESLQKDVIRRALEKHGSLRKAAQALDMDAATLHRLAKKLGIPTG